MKKISTGNVSGANAALQLVRLAYEASSPMGLGWLHEGRVKPNFDLHVRDGSISADYIAGRMVKLWGFSYGDDYIEFDDQRAPRADYQSWCRSYPTNESLAVAAINSLAAKS